MGTKRIVGLWGAGALFVCFSGVAQAQDSDGDQVPDAADAYPCDASLAGEAFAPAEGQVGVMVFEDQWPSKGDLDFNDVLVSYHYRTRLDPQGLAVELHGSFDALALGGLFDNGLGLAIPVSASSVASIERRVAGGPWQALSAFPGETSLTVELSSNLREAYGGAAGQINSQPNLPRAGGALIELRVVFSSPVSLGLGAAPYDLFIFRSNDVGLEIHRPEYRGTLRMNAAYFGTQDDASTASRAFVDGTGLPFALSVPSASEYPLEAVSIDQLFPRILTFASSGGVTDADYYLYPVISAAYRDSAGQGPAQGRIGYASVPPDTSCFAPILDAGAGTFMVGAITGGATTGVCSEVPVSNVGSAAATGLAATLSGPDAAEFQLCSAANSPCGASLAAGGTCNQGVQLAATAAGTYTASLDMSSTQGAAASRALSGDASGFTAPVGGQNLLGYYGSNSAGNSWAAIVGLDTPIAWTDQVDFNNQADAYCLGKGYVGVVKTLNGVFSTNSTYYLQSSDGIIAGNGPSNKITRFPAGVTSITNVYTNRRNTSGFNGMVGIATFVTDDSTIQQAVASPTTGSNQALLCQTTISIATEPGFAPFQPGPGLLGYYGSDSAGNSWTAIERLDSPVSWTDQIDFNDQIDVYCQSKGYVGVAKTLNGAFSTHATYYLQSSDGIIAGNGPSNKITRFPTGVTSIGNVYTNRRNTTGFNGMVGIATFTTNDSTIQQAIASPTTGANQAVLCQTAIPIESEPPLPTSTSSDILGFYGSDSAGNSWAAIVNLYSPVAWTDQVDFNSQVDAYCAGLGFVGVVKTANGVFSTHPTYYLQSSDGIIAGNGPSNKITRFPTGVTSIGNVYTNRRNTSGFNGMVGIATFTTNDSTIQQAVASPSTGANQAVLCQTTQSIGVEPVYVNQ